MSFNVEFTAKVADAKKIVEKEYLPSEVKLFVQAGLRAFADDKLVYVKAQGHLFNGDYQRSSADIVVQEVVLRTAT